jgi:hypothetical protein
MPRLSSLPLAALAVALAALASAAGPASAQAGHEHGSLGAVVIAHDVPADGRTFVGNVNHFAVVAKGDDAVPDFHQDMPWRVTLNGVVLAETTVGSGHDYDGVNTFDIVFPVPGPYSVEALDGSGQALATFHGVVDPTPGAASLATLAWDRDEGLSSGSEHRFEYWVSTRDAPGVPIPHSDCTFEVLRDGRTEFRTKSHTHGENQALEYEFPEPGTYTLRVLCFQAFPSPRAQLFQPAVAQETVEVLPGFAVETLMPGVPLPPPAEMNAVVVAPAGDGMTLVGTFDPYTTVGPDTLQHLNVLAVDGSGQPIQHVDFTAVLEGPSGRLFGSDTLHEYDGIYELTTRQAVPGVYTLRVTAEGSQGAGELAMSYLVLPRAAPLTAGLVAVALDAAPVAGTPGDWLLAATATSGAFAHGELEVRLTAVGNPIPYLQAKLHTHDDGLYPFTVTLPTPEAYTLEVTPFPLTPDLVLPAATSFSVQAAPGQPIPSAGLEPGGSQDAPAVPAALLLVALAAAAVALRRRA